MRKYIPPARVLYASLALAAGIWTNYLHKNTASGVVILVSALAISVWWGTELGKK